MKTKKILFILMIGLSSAIAVRCSQQIITPAQMRQNIIDDAMKPENYRDLKQDLAFLESQGLLQPDSFYNLLQENVTESDDATFNEVIEKAEDLITEHMRDEFISIIDDAFEKNKSFNYFIDNFTCPLFSYVMQRKDNDMILNNIVAGWLLPWSIIKTTDNRPTPLRIAACNGHTEIVQLLLAAGANVNRTDNGASLLHLAACNGHIEIVQLLLEYRANVNFARTNYAVTPLYIATQNGHTEIVRLLLEYGADVNIVINDNRVTPLHIAAQKGYIEIVRILLAAGANVDIQRTDGPTSLYIAVKQVHREIVQLLVQHGANVNIPITDGTTPLYFAAFLGYTEIVQILLAGGANLNIQMDGNGPTPLHVAVDQGHTEIVQILVTAGADVNIQNHYDDGRVAEEIATTDEIRDIFRRARQRKS